MNILIIDNQTKHLEGICKLLPEAPTIVPWDRLSADDALDRNLIILSGGTDIPPVAEFGASYLVEKGIVLGTETPVIGICLGAEVIADAFEGTIAHLGTKRHGIFTITPTDKGAEILGIRSPFDVYEGHSSAITSLPDTFDILATSVDGIEIFRHRTRPLYGLQVHPEYLVDRTSGDEIFRTILRNIS